MCRMPWYIGDKVTKVGLRRKSNNKVQKGMGREMDHLNKKGLKIQHFVISDNLVFQVSNFLSPPVIGYINFIWIKPMTLSLYI